MIRVRRSRRAELSQIVESNYLLNKVTPVRVVPSKATQTEMSSRADPSLAKTSRVKPSRTEPSRAKPSRTEPSRAKPSLSAPSHAEPRRAEPRRVRPSRAVTIEVELTSHPNLSITTCAGPGRASQPTRIGHVRPRLARPPSATGCRPPAGPPRPAALFWLVGRLRCRAAQVHSLEEVWARQPDPAKTLRLLR